MFDFPFLFFSAFHESNQEICINRICSWMHRMYLPKIGCFLKVRNNKFFELKSWWTYFLKKYPWFKFSFETVLLRFLVFQESALILFIYLFILICSSSNKIQFLSFHRSTNTEQRFSTRNKEQLFNIRSREQRFGTRSSSRGCRIKWNKQPYCRNGGISWLYMLWRRKCRGKRWRCIIE